VAFGLVRISLPNQSSSEMLLATDLTRFAMCVCLSDSFVKQPKGARLHSRNAIRARAPARRASLDGRGGAGNAGCLPHRQPRVGM